MARGVREYRDDHRDDRRSDYSEQAASERRAYEQERYRRDDFDRDQYERQEILRRMVNDDAITITPGEMKVINDPEVKMLDDGSVVKRARRSKGGSPFAQQFSRSSLLRGSLIPKAKKTIRKKARKELDKLQSKAFKEANKRLRTVSGKLRKGITQSDVAKLAHKILRKSRK